MHNSANDSKQLQIWYCDECRSVHLKTDNVCLTFSKSEFTELSKAVLEIHKNEINTLIDELPDLYEHDAVLESDLIS